MISLEKNAGVHEDVNVRHREWMSTHSEGSVLDIGCFSGNELSLELAENASIYLAVDLSPSAIEELNRKIKAANIENARAVPGDFLSFKYRVTQNRFDLRSRCAASLS